MARMAFAVVLAPFGGFQLRRHELAHLVRELHAEDVELVGLEERLRLAEMTRKDALDTAEERERSRLAVLRELEDAGPAKCVELMGEVESLRLGLAHKHHELEEEQQ